MRLITPAGRLINLRRYINMADFSALCPLFNTGMYSEISFGGPISLVSRSTTNKFAALPPFSNSCLCSQEHHFCGYGYGGETGYLPGGYLGGNSDCIRYDQSFLDCNHSSQE